MARLYAGPASRAIRSALLCVVLTACASSTDNGPAWRVVLEHQPSGLVSVAGSSARDVWVCGSDSGDGPAVLHWDGGSWSRMTTGTRGDLWWVHVFGPGRALFGGAQGHIVSYADGSFTAEATPGARTVYGVWGTTPSDAWAVGGNPDDQTGFVWRNVSGTWTSVALPDGLASKVAFYKVFGFAADDVYLVGTGGTLLHFDGASFTALNTTPAWTTSEKPLFTAHGAGGRIAAVGGFAGGLLLEYDAGTLTNASPRGLMGLSGVFLTGRDSGWAVGQKLTVLERNTSGWQRVDTGHVRSEDLHAVWADPDGGVWAVGGDIQSLPMSDGLLLHYGATAPRGLE